MPTVPSLRDELLKDFSADPFFSESLRAFDRSLERMAGRPRNPLLCNVDLSLPVRTALLALSSSAASVRRAASSLHLLLGLKFYCLALSSISRKMNSWGVGGVEATPVCRSDEPYASQDLQVSERDGRYQVSCG
ncbi:hypothetical protein FHG87_023637 [Trinorchestia longiramus]|nr:hypothetical protein FHG87_023637 [Trinorchestia longiramus]